MREQTIGGMCWGRTHVMRMKESSCSSVIPGELKLGVLGVGRTSLVYVLEERVGESKLCEEREESDLSSLIMVLGVLGVGGPCFFGVSPPPANNLPTLLVGISLIDKESGEAPNSSFVLFFLGWGGGGGQCFSLWVLGVGEMQSSFSFPNPCSF